MPDVIKATPSEIIDQQSFADPFGHGKRLRLGSNIALAEITREISLTDPEDACKWTPKMKLMPKADPYPDLTLTDSSTITNIGVIRE